MSNVSIIKTKDEYPNSILEDNTHIHKAMLKGFELLGYDVSNPLGHIVKPGNRVFIKPNFVVDVYRASCSMVGDIYSVITHPSVIKAVVDFVAIALNGKGEIIVGDCPSIDADFENLMCVTGLEALMGRYDVPIKFFDLRNEWCDDLKYYGFKSKMKKLSGDPEGSSILNLGKRSLFYRDNPLLFRGIYTKRWGTIKHHLFNKHEYSVSNTMLNSDVFISIPKLKTHRKVAATLNIKGLVGINTDKNFLIHWKIGCPSLGGDEWYNPSGLRGYMSLIFKHIINDLTPESLYFLLRTKTNLSMLNTEVSPCGHKHRGSGEKNETCWKMAADLYKVFIEDRKSTTKFFSIVDGITSGEGNGPFCPTSRQDGVLVMGEDLVEVDCASVKLMGFAPAEVGYLKYFLNGNYDVDTSYYPKKFELNFKAPEGWKSL